MSQHIFFDINDTLRCQCSRYQADCATEGGRVVRWCWVNFQFRGVLLIWILVGQGPTALTEDAGGGCLDILLSSIISLFYLLLSGRRHDID